MEWGKWRHKRDHSIVYEVRFTDDVCEFRRVGERGHPVTAPAKTWMEIYEPVEDQEG
jgi:hypothetical protein